MNAELLIMVTLDCDRAYLYAHPERALTPGEMHRYHEALARRANGVPAQYITGHQEFWGLDLIVPPAVLIPRQETEHIVEAVLELAKPKVTERRESPQACRRSPERSRGVSRTVRIVDVGTGSGSHAFAISKELPTAEIPPPYSSSQDRQVRRGQPR